MYYPALPSSRRTATLATAALVLAVCGRGPNQSADRNGADTTSADRSALGAPVLNNRATLEGVSPRGHRP